MSGEPLHRRARQEVTFGIFRARWKTRVFFWVIKASSDIGHGIDQQLRGEIDTRVAAGDRGGRRQIAAGAVAGDTETRGISAEPGDACDHVAHGRKAVLERAGKARFGRAPVVDGDDDGAGLNGEQACLPVMGFEIAGDPAAAMEKHHGRRFRVVDAIDARGQRPGRTLHLDIADVLDRRRRNVGARRRQRPQRIARALWGHGIGIAQRQLWNDFGDHGIERGGHAGSGH